MINSKKHKIIINKIRFEVVSADTVFYEFLGDSRFYYSFDQLLAEEDKAKFIDNVKNGYPDWFVVHIMALKGPNVPCYAKLEEISGSENVTIVLLDIDKLRESEWLLDKRSRVNEAIHGLYGDDAFVYYPNKDMVEIVTGTGAHMTSETMFLSTLQKNLEAVTEDKNSVNEFITGLRNGSRYLFVKADGSIRNNGNESKHSIIKCAGLYENGVYTMAVGYIHEYMERTYTDTRKV